MINRLGIAIYAIFLGAQITEGCLLVPYWQALSAEAFYSYYHSFGPVIGRFYTILTIVASAVPISIALKSLIQKHKTSAYALLSGFFALLVIVSFYAYFKDTNQRFYDEAFTEAALAKELVKWSYWHWSRILLEIFSLGFLILTFSKTDSE